MPPFGIKANKKPLLLFMLYSNNSSKGIISLMTKTRLLLVQSHVVLQCQRSRLT